MSKVIGIDLGTSNSCVAVMESGSAKVITNEEGARTTPSIVSYVNGERMVGSPAKRQAIMKPKNTIYSAKRFIGMKFDEVQEEAESMPYDVRKSGHGTCEIVIDGEGLAPAAISAQVLVKMKEAAEAYLGHEVAEAVITVPAYFNDSQRQATKDAGKIAGLDIKRVINEPTAAALAYGMDKGDDKRILVYDLGGGTFDVSVLEIGDGVVEVMSTNGDTHLGGDDVDKILIDWLIDSFKTDSGVDVSKDSMVIQRLRDAAEKAKIELSSTQQTDINLPFLTADNTGPKHLNISLTRSKFEQMIDFLVQKTMDPIKNALKDAGLSASGIDEIVLVGGSTRIPAVRKCVEEYFGKKASSSVNPDEVVALGAAVQGGVFSGEVNDILLLDVTPLSLGIETMGGVMTRLIERNSTIPCTKSQVFSTAENNQTSVDVKVLQGEREFSTDNKCLGNFRLDGIPPAPRGVPQIEVSFDIDANGIVSVKAVDKATNKEQNIVITGSGALEETDIEEMIKDAELHREKDKLRREEVDVKNSLDSTIYQSKNLVEENKEKVSPETIELVERSISSAELATDLEGMKTALSSLQEATGKLATELYSQTQQESESSSPPEENSDSSGENEDVIDANFEDSSETA